MISSGRWGPYRQASPHRPDTAGARSGASRDDLLKIPETARENIDDDPCVRNGVAVAADRRRDLARVSARPPERPHPAAAGIDRETTRAARAGTAAGGRPGCRSARSRRTSSCRISPERRHKLSEFRGKDVLLIFFNPKCGFCTKMADDLAALPLDGGRRPGHAGRGHHRRSRGEPAARRASRHSLRGPAAGGDGSRLAVPRPGDADGLSDRRRGTHRQRTDGRRRSRCCNWRQPPHARPSGTGRIERNGMAAPHGKQPDPSLARSRLNRNGLKAGAAAPDFRLPRIDGGELSLDGFPGQARAAGVLRSRLRPLRGAGAAAAGDSPAAAGSAGARGQPARTSRRIAPRPPRSG